MSAADYNRLGLNPGSATYWLQTCKKLPFLDLPFLNYKISIKIAPTSQEFVRRIKCINVLLSTWLSVWQRIGNKCHY